MFYSNYVSTRSDIAARINQAVKTRQYRVYRDMLIAANSDVTNVHMIIGKFGRHATWQRRRSRNLISSSNTLLIILSTWNAVPRVVIPLYSM